MPVKITVSCSDGEKHQIELTLGKGSGTAEGEPLEHPSLKLIKSFVAFEATAPPCMEQIEGFKMDPSGFMLDHLPEFFEQMKHVRNRRDFFKVDSDSHANERLKLFLEEILHDWVELPSSHRDDDVPGIIEDFLQETDEVSAESGIKADDVSHLLSDVIGDAIGFAVEEDDNDAVSTLTEVTTYIDYHVYVDNEYPEEISSTVRRVETAAFLEIGQYTSEWEVCVEGSYTDLMLEDWELDDCGSTSPDYAATTFLDAVGESYDPSDMVDLDPPDRPEPDGEGEVAVFAGSDCLGIFYDYGEAETFAEMAQDVATRRGSYQNIDVMTLTDEAREKYEEEGDLDDWEDLSNWE